MWLFCLPQQPPPYNAVAAALVCNLRAHPAADFAARERQQQADCQGLVELDCMAGSRRVAVVAVPWARVAWATPVSARADWSRAPAVAVRAAAAARTRKVRVLDVLLVIEASSSS